MCAMNSCSFSEMLAGKVKSRVMSVCMSISRRAKLGDAAVSWVSDMLLASVLDEMDRVKACEARDAKMCCMGL